MLKFDAGGGGGGAAGAAAGAAAQQAVGKAERKEDRSRHPSPRAVAEGAPSREKKLRVASAHILAAGQKATAAGAAGAAGPWAWPSGRRNRPGHAPHANEDAPPAYNAIGQASPSWAYTHTRTHPADDNNKGDRSIHNNSTAAATTRATLPLALPSRQRVLS